MEKGKLSFALVGCGRIAQRHAEHISKLGDLKAVCDVKNERADALAEKYEAKAYYSVDDLLLNEDHIDMVSVCTPNGLHCEHTVKALQNGYNVLCEKPMATSVIDCEKMIFEAEKHNKRLFIVKQNRFNPPVAAVKKAIDEGRLGKIFNIQINCFWNRNVEYYKDSDWKGNGQLDAGTLFTQFSHFIDIAYWMVGDVKKAYGLTHNFLNEEHVDFEDTGVAILDFYSGAIGTINFTINSYKKNMEGSITVFGEKGTVKIGGQYLNELEYQEIEDYKIEYSGKSRAANDYGFYKGSMSNHDKIYENIVDTLSNSGFIATSGLEGMKVVQIIEKIYNSPPQ